MGRSIAALVLAVLAGVLAIFAIWANQQLLDSGSWGSVSGELLKSERVRHRVAAFLGETLVEETESQLLAAGEAQTAARVMPRLRRNDVRLAERVMATPRFRAIWAAANRSGHAALLRVLDEEASRDEGGVAVDLTPALRRVADLLGREGPAEELGVGSLGDLVEPGAARIEVLEAQELEVAQDVVRVVRHLTLLALLATLALYALALLLGRRRLPRAFLGVGIALLATGALALFARAVAGHAVVDALLAHDADREAADAAWRIATSTIADVSIGVIIAGALLIAAVATRSLFSRERYQGSEAG
ncbi:MAG TPA: hypothetical protein VMF55_04005 [Solirubrobacterales bacterium]|nr:hypothetical protein [Solirubrobacterales bacterium]